MAARCAPRRGSPRGPLSTGGAKCPRHPGTAHHPAPRPRDPRVWWVRIAGRNQLATPPRRGLPGSGCGGSHRGAKRTRHTPAPRPRRLRGVVGSHRGAKPTRHTPAPRPPGLRGVGGFGSRGETNSPHPRAEADRRAEGCGGFASRGETGLATPPRRGLPGEGCGGFGTRRGETNSPHPRAEASQAEGCGGFAFAGRNHSPHPRHAWRLAPAGAAHRHILKARGPEPPRRPRARTGL